MKIVHLSDLHLGKKLKDFSLHEDQEFILRKILSVIDNETPDCIIIAGDIYDKSIPSSESVSLCDWFICSLAERNLPVFIISGNHDSAERIAFAEKLLHISGIHISPVYNGTVEPISLTDENGRVNFYMLPFIRPVAVRRFFPDIEISSYTDAVNAAIDAMNIDFSERNIIITHQFVTGASSCDSEEHLVGGIENVDSSAFDGFDYVALGHIHNPQNIGSERIRYCGTPLKYSISEANNEKSVTVVELAEKGNLQIKTVPLEPLRDVRKITDTFDNLKSGEKSDDFISVILTDEEDVPDAMNKLRRIYKNIMTVDYDNKRTQNTTDFTDKTASENKSPLELFGDFYTLQNNDDMSDEKKAYLSQLIEKIWGEEL
jgi:exonuclease SbcD